MIKPSRKDIINGAKALSDVQGEQMQLKNDIDNLVDQSKK